MYRMVKQAEKVSAAEDFVKDFPLTDEYVARQEAKRVGRELADEADAYDLEHEEGIYSADDVKTSQCSFDFEHDGNYDYNALKSAIMQAMHNAGVDPIDLDFYSVDYSMYPGYRDSIISQCGVDFSWSTDYSEENIEIELQSALEAFGYNLVGINFESLE